VRPSGACRSGCSHCRCSCSCRSRYDLFREKLGYLEGGSDTLLQALLADIERLGGEFRLSSPVSKVVVADGAVRGVEVGGGFEPFDKVVSTVPLPFVPRLLPDLPEAILEQYRAVANGAVVCVIAKLRRTVTENF
jgi:protoporphyrinogen oxidase